MPKHCDFAFSKKEFKRIIENNPIEKNFKELPYYDNMNKLNF